MVKIINKIKCLLLFLAAILVAAPGVAQQLLREKPPEVAQRVQASLANVASKDLPPEARETLALIDKGGPFPFDRDGIVFGNFEKRLPIKERGYYKEYTVKTPGVRHRGARRIVTGQRGERYYSDDHYQSFRRIIQ